MLVSTGSATIVKLREFYQKGNQLLLVVGSALAVIGAWIVVEAILAVRRGDRHDSDLIEPRSN